MNKVYYYEVQGIDLKNNRTFCTITCYECKNDTDMSREQITDLIKKDYIKQGYNVKYILNTHLCLVNKGLSMEILYRNDVCYSESNFKKININIKTKQ